ncbi:MAG: PEP/pyruvate-binding domain-containing protein, partial [Candidatus Woesearchaeota archaeon]
MGREKEFILWFKDLKIEDVPLVGGKNASLGEMYSELTRKGVRIPNGFATTAHAYKYLLSHSGIEKEMQALLEGLDVKNVKQLAERGRKIRELIRTAEFPEDLKEAIFKAYRQLSR